MKKRISLVLTLAAAALTAAAFHVAQFAPVRDVPFSLGTEGGKVTAVEVFAPTNGSVALSSIYTADLFTNAVQITRSTNTLYTVVFSNLVDAVIITNANNVGYAKTPYPYTPISSKSVSFGTRPRRIFKKRNRVRRSRKYSSTVFWEWPLMVSW